MNAYRKHADPFSLEEIVDAGPLPPLTSEPAEDWISYFKYDQYDWNDPEFKKKNRGRYAYRPIRLTQGYFMMVSVRDYDRMTKFPDGSPKRWFIKITRKGESGGPLKAYACRRGRANEPADVYAHRELLGCLAKNGMVDHRNGWGLDNRRGTPTQRVNLLYVTTLENRHNSVRRRTKHEGLPVGVERRRNGRYGGIRCKRLGKNRVLVIRSKKSWAAPEPAARWYQNELKKIHKRTIWAHALPIVHRPEFPPLLESEVSKKSLRLRAKHRIDAHVPF